MILDMPQRDLTADGTDPSFASRACETAEGNASEDKWARMDTDGLAVLHAGGICELESVFVWEDPAFAEGLL